MKDNSPFNDEFLQYLQKTLKVSRKELIETIKLSHVSAQDIAKYVKEKKLCVGNRTRFS
jgi:hypothetical protein